MSFADYVKTGVIDYTPSMGEYNYPSELKEKTQALSVFEQTKYLCVSIKDVYDDKTIDRLKPLTEALNFYGLIVDNDIVVGIVRNNKDRISFSLIGVQDLVYEAEDNEGSGYNTLDSYETITYSLEADYEAFYPITQIPTSVKVVTSDLISEGKYNAVCFGKNVKKINEGSFDCVNEVFYTGDFESWLRIEGRENINATVRFLDKNNVEIDDLVIDNLEVIPDYAFYRVKLNSVTLPLNLKKFGTNAFSFASITTLIYTGDLYSWLNIQNKSYSSIPTDLVFNGESVKRLVLPEDITVIPEYAFHACSYLEEIVLHDKLTTIQEAAFFGSSVRNLTIPASVTEIGPHILSCTDVERVDLYAKPSALTKFKTRDLYVHLSIKDWCSVKKSDLSIKQIHFVGENGEELHDLVDNEVEMITPYCFYHCDDLESISLPNVSMIGDCAFMGCSYLLEVDIPSVKTIGNHAFRECDSLYSISLPEGLIEMGDSVFCNCKDLSEVYLPSTLKNAGSTLFYGCYQLEQICCGASSPKKGWAKDWNSVAYGNASFKGYSINNIIWNDTPDA